MKMLEHVDQYTGEYYRLTLNTTTYCNNGNLAIQAFCDDGSPYCTVSVNICELPHCMFAYDLNNNGETLLKELIDQGFVELSNNYLTSGYCTYPVCIWKGDRDED